VLATLVVVTATAWWLSGWAWWPWTGGAGALIVLALVGMPRRIGPAYTFAVVLAVVDVWLLLLVDPWWWGVLVGVVLTGASTAAAVKLRFRTRRRETAVALVLGVAMLVTSVTMLAVDAAAEAEQAQRELDQAHDEAVARILPRTAGSMVSFLVERIGMAPTHPESVKDTCFVFSPAAQRQLADALGAPDCSGAVYALGAQVRDRGDYINNLWLPGAATTRGPEPGVQVVDACHLDFSSLTDDNATPNPGPQLGVLTLRQQQGQGNLITAYRPCAAGR
jgi:hypothetical protein